MPPPSDGSVLKVEAPDAAVSAFHVEAAVGVVERRGRAADALEQVAPDLDAGERRRRTWRGPSACSTMIGVASTEASS